MKQPPAPNQYRDTWCGDLRAEAAGDRVRVAGWVHRRRDHGGLVFIDLRDRSGLVQLVFHPDSSGPAFAIAESLRSEHVLTAEGEIVAREKGAVNDKIPTGEIEIRVAGAERLATAETPPFPLDDDGQVDEMLRLTHRALDLRRETMQEALILRHRVVSTMRRELEQRDFLEIETPILTKSTPEGARDFLVPSRMQPSSFYALPQSPQLFKQLLMISGFERYYQIARCFRDEDLRADRQPEFSQLDVEMAFVTEEDVIATMEAVMAPVLELGDLGLSAPPWPRIPYDEAMSRYGSDRPDRRFGLELRDLSGALSGSQFKVFQSVIDSGGAVLALNAGRRDVPRRELDGFNELAQKYGGKAIAYAFVEAGGTWRSPIAKFFTEDQVAAATNVLEASEGDLLLFAADRVGVARTVLGGIRLELAERWGLIPDGVHDVHWVVDFPAFEFDEEEGRYQALHHPFTAPTGDLADPAALRSRAYDMVVDGSELGGGSIRIHSVDTQRAVFGIIGMDEEEAQSRFGFLLDALRHGAPPHGGIAFGIDRIVAILAQRDSIRDVMAFPKTASGSDPMTGAPSRVDARQLRELGLRTL